MIKIECSVQLVPTDKVSNIRMFEDGKLDWRGKNSEGGDSVIVSFQDTNGYTIATSDSTDEYPQIGLDFLWPYVQTKKRITSVYVSFKEEYPLTCNNVKLHSDGTVIVSRCDEKEYSEKDVILMLSYAVAHEKVTSSEMKAKVEEILNWFKSYK
jgi:hypothetical protein